jgi:hypothetical protein
MTPKDLRQFLLTHGQPILAQYINAATGAKMFDPKQDEKARDKIFDILKELILNAPDLLSPQVGLNLTDGDISARVDNVLSAVANGDIAPSEAKQLMELLNAGFELTEIKDLTDKLKEAGLIK